MRLCLRCFHLWPAESLFCGHCGRSLGARLCAKGHRNPVNATRCLTCGEAVGDYAPYLPLGWVSRLLALLVVCAALRWGIRHVCCVSAFLLDALTGVASFVLDVPKPLVVLSVFRFMNWFLILFLLSWFLPGASGKSLRTVLWKVLELTLMVSTKAIALLWRLAVGSGKKPDKKKKAS